MLNSKFNSLLKSQIAALSLFLAACGAGLDTSSNRDSANEEGLQAATLPPPPSGFNLINTWSYTSGGSSHTAIRLYKKDYSGGTPDYVAVIDLRYATLMSVTGSSASAPCCTLTRKPFGPGSGSLWADATSLNSATRTARLLINGAFFSTITKAPIAFGLKNSGSICSYGYAVSGSMCITGAEYTGSINTFSFNLSTGGASIEPYSKSTFTGSAPDVIGGLSPTCCKTPTVYRPRTMVGLRDDDIDGVAETMFIFSSANSLLTKVGPNLGADEILQAFGATQRIQLDGGTSTGLIVDGVSKIGPGYYLPHALAIFSGK